MFCSRISCQTSNALQFHQTNCFHVTSAIKHDGVCKVKTRKGLHSNMRQEIVDCALRRWEEDFSLINMRWILQPEKVLASVFLHGRQFDLQTGRQSAPAGQAAALVVVVRYQMHQTQQRCPLQCVQHIAASSIIKSPPLLLIALTRHRHFLRLHRSETKPT